MDFGPATLHTIHLLIHFACSSGDIEGITVERELNATLRARPITASRIVWAAAVHRVFEMSLPVHEEANTLCDKLIAEFTAKRLQPPQDTFLPKIADRLIDPPEVSMLGFTRIPEDIEILKQGFIALVTNWTYKELLACKLKRLLGKFTPVGRYARRANHVIQVQSVGAVANGHPNFNGDALGSSHVNGNGLGHSSGAAQNDGANDHVMGNGHALGNGHCPGNGHRWGNGQRLSNGQIYSNSRADGNGHAILDSHAASNGRAMGNGHINGNWRINRDDHTNGKGQMNGNGTDHE